MSTRKTGWSQWQSCDQEFKLTLEKYIKRDLHHQSSELASYQSTIWQTGVPVTCRTKHASVSAWSVATLKSYSAQLGGAETGLKDDFSCIGCTNPDNDCHIHTTPDGYQDCITRNLLHKSK
jgi:hypothetical protein